MAPTDGGQTPDTAATRTYWDLTNRRFTLTSGIGPWSGDVASSAWVLDARSGQPGWNWNNNLSDYNSVLNKSTDASLPSGNNGNDIVLRALANTTIGDTFTIFVPKGKAQRIQMYIGGGSPANIRKIDGTAVTDYYLNSSRTAAGHSVRFTVVEISGTRYYQESSAITDRVTTDYFVSETRLASDFSYEKASARGQKIMTFALPTTAASNVITPSSITYESGIPSGFSTLSSGTNVSVPDLPPDPNVNGIIAVAVEGTTERSEAFLPWGPGALISEADDTDKASGSLHFDDGEKVNVNYFHNTLDGPQININGAGDTLPTGAKVEFYLAVIGTGSMGPPGTNGTDGTQGVAGAAGPGLGMAYIGSYARNNNAANTMNLTDPTSPWTNPITLSNYSDKDYIVNFGTNNWHNLSGADLNGLTKITAGQVASETVAAGNNVAITDGSTTYYVGIRTDGALFVGTSVAGGSISFTIFGGTPIVEVLQGSFERSIYRASESSPTTPTSPNSIANSSDTPTVPTGWSDSPPDSTDPIWASIQRVNRGSKTVTYTTPRQWDGADGESGEDNPKHIVNFRTEDGSSANSAGLTFFIQVG